MVILEHSLQESISAYYNQASYDVIRGQSNQEKKELLYAYEILLQEIPSPCRVLDLGCGNGLMVHRLLKNHAIDYLGVDLSYRQIEYAQQKNPTHRYLLADFLRFPFTSNSYDLIFLRDVWHQIPLVEQEQFLSCAANILKSSGLLLIAQSKAPNPLEPSNGEDVGIQTAQSLLQSTAWHLLLKKQEPKTNAWVLIARTPL